MYAKRRRAIGCEHAHEFLYKILRECRLKQFYEIDPADSWMVAAAHKNLPLFVPGWEDSTLGNICAARCITGVIKHVQAIRSGIEYMIELAAWYRELSKDSSIGFFQIGGGIAGDFPICVVPMMTAMLCVENVLADTKLYDLWQVNSDAEYHEAGPIVAEETNGSGLRLVPTRVGTPELAPEA